MSIRAYVNPYPPRFTEAWQRAHLSPEAVVYTQTRGGEERDRLIRSLRPGDVVEVYPLMLLAKLNGGAKRRVADLLKAIEAILEQKAVIREGKDGPSTRKGWNAALVRAREAIGSSARGMATGAKNGNLSKGRPRHESKWPPQVRVICEREWHSKKHKTKMIAHARINELLEPLGVQVTRGWLYMNIK